MESRVFITSTFVIAIVCVGFFAFIIYYIINTHDNSSANIELLNSLEECKTLIYNNENALSIVFFADRETSQKYADFLLSIKPFSQQKESFNFYYLDNYIPICERYKNIALFCHSSKLIKKAASCPHDFIIAIKEDESKIRSSSYATVISLNSKHPLAVFAHEFGHALAALDEEYTPTYLSSNSKNCKSSCDAFSYDIDGCFVGCSRDNKYRSIDAGVMRTLSATNYGIWNEHVLLEQLTESIYPLALSGKIIDEDQTCSKQFYYLITGMYTPEKSTILRRTLERGCVGGNGIGDITLTQYDQQGAALNTETINTHLIYTDSPPTNPATNNIEGEVFINEGKEFTITLPVSTSIQTLRIEQPGSQTIDIFLNDIGARACRISSS